MLTLLLLSVIASPVGAELLVIDSAWVRAMPPSVNSTAAYMRVANNSDLPVDIVEVTSEAANIVQMHEHAMDNGLMAMQQVFNVQIPAKSEFLFVPGGHHIMLMGLTAPLQEGDTVVLTLKMKNGASQVVQAMVMKESSARAPSVHSH